MKTRVHFESKRDIPDWPYETIELMCGVKLAVQASLRTSTDMRHKAPYIVHTDYKTDSITLRVFIGDPTTGLVELEDLSCAISYARREREIDQLFDAGPEKTDPSNPVRALMCAGLFSSRTPGYLRVAATRVVDQCAAMADRMARS